MRVNILVVIINLLHNNLVIYLPANYIKFSRGRDISPNPLPKSGRINFLAYPVLEIEGKPDLVETTFTFKRNNKNS